MLENTSQLSSLPKSPGGFVYKRHKPEESDLYKIIEQNNTVPGLDEDLGHPDPARAPSLVTPAVLYMCREDAPTGKIIMAGNGRFGYVGVFRNEGVELGVDATLESLLEQEDIVTDMSQSQHSAPWASW